MTKCINCKRECEFFDRSKEAVKGCLLSNDSSLYSLIVFFEYFSPNTSSNLSYRIDMEQSDKILQNMLKKGFEGNQNFEFFTSSLTEEVLEKYSLDGKSIKSSCKRFVCNICPKDNKNRLTSLMRHIRNSIAHGRFAVIKNGNYYKLFLEDVGNEKITFRMVINHSTLKKWKEILIEASKKVCM